MRLLIHCTNFIIERSEFTAMYLCGKEIDLYTLRIESYWSCIGLGLIFGIEASLSTPGVYEESLRLTEFVPVVPGTNLHRSASNSPTKVHFVGRWTALATRICEQLDQHQLLVIKYVLGQGREDRLKVHTSRDIMDAADKVLLLIRENIIAHNPMVWEINAVSTCSCVLRWAYKGGGNAQTLNS